MKTQIKFLKTKMLLMGGGLLFSIGLMGQSTVTDSICSGSQDVLYGILNSNSTSTYAWSLSDPLAGTIDNSQAPNDSIIHIDWGTTIGSYTLYAIETTADGCTGDTVSLDIVINPLPTVALAGDSVCANTASQITFTFTGQAPWIVDYTDGTNNFTDTASVSPFTATLPAYASTATITVTGVTDGGSCSADASGLPSTSVVIYAKPSTGAIFHY